AGDREAEAAVVEMVDDLDRDFVGARIPEERDLEAVLVAVGELLGGCVRHRGSFPVADLRLDSPIMRRGPCRSRPGRPHSYPGPFPRPGTALGSTAARYVSRRGATPERRVLR